MQRDLDTKILQRWIGRGCPIKCPARYPELSTFDSFLCGSVKDFLFSVEISSLSHIQERSRRPIEGITTQTIGKVWKNKHTRINRAVTVIGGHIKQGNI